MLCNMKYMYDEILISQCYHHSFSLINDSLLKISNWYPPFLSFHGRKALMLFVYVLDSKGGDHSSCICMSVFVYDGWMDHLDACLYVHTHTKIRHRLRYSGC